LSLFQLVGVVSTHCGCFNLLLLFQLVAVVSTRCGCFSQRDVVVCRRRVTCYVMSSGWCMWVRDFTVSCREELGRSPRLLRVLMNSVGLSLSQSLSVCLSVCLCFATVITAEWYYTDSGCCWQCCCSPTVAADGGELVDVDYMSSTVDLSGIEVVDADRRFIRQARKDVDLQAHKMLEQGIESLVQLTIVLHTHCW